MTALGSRTHALERLAATARGDALDVLVVGGGITGAGIALDAASRGLKVGLAEAADFASGTSSKSSKLVHGGLRYLEQREFGLVREASVERDLLRKLAPHLVEPIPFVIPVSDRWKRAMFGAGLWAYDALAAARNLKVHRHLDQSETEDLVPPLPRNQVKGGYLFYDCRTDDVRLVMEVLVQARRYGAVIANYARVTHLDGSDDACRVHLRDEIGDSTIEVAARRVIVAAGVWSDEVEKLARSDAGDRLRPSKGVHLVFRRDVIPIGDAAVFIPDAQRKRMLFVIPWIDAVIVGTTDTPYSGSLESPTVTTEDRDYCLDALNSVFGTDLSAADIAGAYAGLRPLISGRAGATADLSRRHTVYDIAPGILGITGGKLTTYRRMAIDVVDRAGEAFGALPKSKTRWIRLGTSDLDGLRLGARARARELGIADAVAANLVRVYGDRARDVLEIAARERLTEPLVADRLPIAAEAAYCVREEMVETADDFLSRRTRLALTDPQAGTGAASTVMDVLATAAGWNRRRQRSLLEAYRRKIEEERGVPLAVTDGRRRRARWLYRRDERPPHPEAEPASGKC